MTRKAQCIEGGCRKGFFTSESASGLVQAALCRAPSYAEQKGMAQQEDFSFQEFVL